MKAIYTLSLLLAFLFSSADVSAQIFGRIINKATDKIRDKAEDRIAEEIANAVYRSIDRKMDEMFREQYRQDSINGKTTASYEAYMAAMFKEVDLPESYMFDGKITYEFKENKDAYIMDMYYAKEKAILGYGQPEENTLMIYDMENDIISIYNLEEKTVQALPNFLNYAALGPIDSLEITVTKTGKTKKVAGYNSYEYIVEDDERKTTAYITEELPFDLSDTFYGIVKELNPNYSEAHKINGVMLLSDIKEKNSKKKSSMKATEVDLSQITVNNDEYKKTTTLEEE